MHYFTVNLSYMDGEVMAYPLDYMILSSLGKVVFLTDIIYVSVYGERQIHYFYGTLNTPFGSEFWEIEDVLNPDFQRKLLYKLTAMGIVRSIASLYPVSEVDH